MQRASEAPNRARKEQWANDGKISEVASEFSASTSATIRPDARSFNAAMSGRFIGDIGDISDLVSVGATEIISHNIYVKF